MPGLALPARACREWRRPDTGAAEPPAAEAAGEGAPPEAPSDAKAAPPSVALPSKACRAQRAESPEEERMTSVPTLPGTLLPLVRSGRSKNPPSPEDQKSRSGRGLDSRALIHSHFDEEITQRYEFESGELGFGGYGRVFLARDRDSHGRRVAIKKVVIMDSDMRDDVDREISIMKQLDHPNICKVFESFDQGRSVYLVMEYLEGGELLERILEEETIKEHLSAPIVQQVARALKYAHGRKIAHRDLKPENIVYCSKDPASNHIKVIDWGVSSCFGFRRMRSNVGSASYCAPEVMEGKNYTAACDLWGLGMLLYIMLCGEPPFQGSAIQQYEQMTNLEETGVPMRGLAWRTISEPAKDLVRGLLRQDPQKRLELDQVLEHPWLQLKESITPDALATKQVLSNLRRFSRTNNFFSLCAATVARQLDHNGLSELREVFREMDSNQDGVLQFHEMRLGFERIFGEDSAKLRDIEEVFARLDLDGSGVVDYSEFCAAGLGERMTSETDALWAAFKAFDINDGDGKLSREEVVQVLERADSGNLWSEEVRQQMAKDIFERFDKDGDGCLDFDEWLRLMRACARRESCVLSPGHADVTPSDRMSSVASLRMSAMPSLASAPGERAQEGGLGMLSALGQRLWGLKPGRSAALSA